MTHLLLREMLSPKKVQIPRDIVREQMSVTMADTPRPTLLFTRSILPSEEGEKELKGRKRRKREREGGREREREGGREEGGRKREGEGWREGGGNE